MKTLSAIALMSLVACGAYAADMPAAGKSHQQAAAAAKSCEKEATAKNLHGDAHAKFVKECKEGKHTS